MGSKSQNLKSLASAGFRVPIFIDVEPAVLRQGDLEALVQKELGSTLLFAVRSSASVEDGADKSYAGHFHTELGVSFNQVFKAYLKVSASLTGFEGKVIIQQFIPASKSGVLFTDNGHGLTVVNSNFGLCKTVVDGETCDEWYVNGENKLIRKSIAPNKKPLAFFKNEIHYADITSSESLTSLELIELVAECRKIETFFACSQDIEWCFIENQLYILQARPITRKLPLLSFIYFDSANIAESYSGIVLPLTQSFAVRIYKTVYNNLLVASGVSRIKVNEHNQIFNSLVAGYYGRMFYNMNSWYLMMSFLPGYKRNKQNLEKMLTMNVSEDIIRSVHPAFSLKFSYPFIVIWKLVFFNRTIRNFENRTRAMLNESRKIDFNSFSDEQCLSYYQLLEKVLLNNFHIPVENDFLMMTYLGILRKKYPGDQLRDLLAFESVSSKQVDSIATLSKTLYAENEFKTAIEAENVIEFKRLLKNNLTIDEAIDSYFSCYSGRFANELKLESADIENDYSLFLKLLKAYHGKQPQKRDIKLKPKGFLFKKFFKYASKREDLRLLRSNCFSLVRRIFVRLGDIYVSQGKLNESKDIFYCSLDEVFRMHKSGSDIHDAIKNRKHEYEEFKTINTPGFFALLENEMPQFLNDESIQNDDLKGRACNSGTIKGTVRVFKEFEMPDKIDFDIIVAKNTDPGWSLLIGLCKGMIIENGGILSHAAIVSRELGIPTVIGVEGATKKLVTGQTVELNGATGIIKIINP